LPINGETSWVVHWPLTDSGRRERFILLNPTRRNGLKQDGINRNESRFRTPHSIDLGIRRNSLNRVGNTDSTLDKADVVNRYPSLSDVPPEGLKRWKAAEIAAAEAASGRDLIDH
jgi:hypothetical protein